MAPEVLLSELPPDPSKSWPLAALATYQQQVQAIKDLCQRHRGEVREISGEWTHIDHPFPEPATGGIHFFHAQFCLSAERARGRSHSYSWPEHVEAVGRQHWRTRSYSRPLAACLCVAGVVR